MKEPLAAGALLLSLCLLSGCQDEGYAGPLARLSGSFNSWARGEQAPALHWDGAVYRGEVALPGDPLRLQIYFPYTDEMAGAARKDSRAVPVPAVIDISERGPRADPLRVDTPLPARYEVVFDPRRQRLRIDLAPGVEAELPPGAAHLAAALRGADELSPEERRVRAAELARVVQDLSVATPIVLDRQRGREGLLFLRFGAVDSPDLSVVGDFNEWTEGRAPMQLVLDGTVAYHARLASGVRLEYRLALHGLRAADPLNPDVIWDGAYLPPNLRNLLGGNAGEFNSVAMAPGYSEQGSRLQRLVVKEREVYVYLPPGYDKPAAQDRQYPSLYVHDGKDAIVRGAYNTSLDRLVRSGAIPPVVAVFIPARSDTAARLAEYAHVPDPLFKEITPQGMAYEQFVLEALLPEVERRYRVRTSGADRAMLGIDMAGPFSFYLAWRDQQARFLRVASQSGRFGWGATADASLPYLNVFKAIDRTQDVKRISFDWAIWDHFQVDAVTDAIRTYFERINPGYAGKTHFLRQERPPPQSATAWDHWRTRLDETLSFLLGDLK
jgi:hypothetical protein